MALMLRILILMLLPTVAIAGDARGLFYAGGVAHGTLTLNANGTYTNTGPAAVNYVGPHFTVTLPATATSLSVTAAGAAGATFGISNYGGKGCVITATGVTITGGSTLTAKVGVKPADGSATGGYGGGSGHDGYSLANQMGGGGSTSLAQGTSILIEAGAGSGGSGGGFGMDASGDGGGVQDSTHGNISGTINSQGGGWMALSSNPYTVYSRIVSGSGSYATGASGNTGPGYLVITY